jgi:LysR family hydrogen peroxide-inducible transcriptional activator
MVWRRSFPRLSAIKSLRDGILASGIKGVRLLPDAKAEHP